MAPKSSMTSIPVHIPRSFTARRLPGPRVFKADRPEQNSQSTTVLRRRNISWNLGLRINILNLAASDPGPPGPTLGLGEFSPLDLPAYYLDLEKFRLPATNPVPCPGRPGWCATVQSPARTSEKETLLLGTWRSSRAFRPRNHGSERPERRFQPDL